MTEPTIHGVLLRPHDRAHLGDWPLVRPPLACATYLGDWPPPEGVRVNRHDWELETGNPAHAGALARALILRWDGEPVWSGLHHLDGLVLAVQGVDRLEWLQRAVTWPGQGSSHEGDRPDYHGPGAHELTMGWRAAAWHSMGTLYVLDADYREIDWRELWGPR